MADPNIQATEEQIAMQQFTVAMQQADFQVRNTGKDLALFDRQLKVANASLIKINQSLAILHRIISGLGRPGTSTLSSGSANNQLLATAVNANTVASQNIVRATMANTAAIRALMIIASAGAASSAASYASSPGRRQAPTATPQNTTTEFKFPAYDISQDIVPINKGSTEEQKKKRRDAYAMKGHNALLAANSKILGVPLETPAEPVPNVPLELNQPGQVPAAPTRDELLKTRMAQVDDQERERALKFKQKHGALPGGQKPSGMSDVEWEKLNKTFESQQKGLRNRAINAFNKQQDSVELQLAQAQAAQSATVNASTPPVPGAGGWVNRPTWSSSGVPAPATGTPGAQPAAGAATGASTAQQTAQAQASAQAQAAQQAQAQATLNALGAVPAWTQPGGLRKKVNRAQQNATNSGVTAPGGMAMGGSGILGLLTNISVQITRLTNAALTNSTIYVHDTHAVRELQVIRNLMASGAAGGPGGPSNSSGAGAGGNKKGSIGAIGEAMGDLSNMALAATTTMMAMVAVADPSTFSTFAGSIKLLAAEIGSVFSPFLREAAFRVQDLTDMFNTGLSPETKKMIGYIGAGTAMLAGMSVGIRVLTGVFGPLATIIYRTGTLLRVGLLLTPGGFGIAAGIAAITAAVALATGNFNNWTAAIVSTGSAIAGLPKKGVDAALGMGDFAKEKTASQKIGELPENYQKAIKAAKGPEEIDKFVSAEKEKIQAEIEKSREAIIPEIAGQEKLRDKQKEFISKYQKALEKKFDSFHQNYVDDLELQKELNPGNAYIFDPKIKSGTIESNSKAGIEYGRQLSQTQAQFPKFAVQEGIPFAQREIDSIFKSLRDPLGRILSPTKERMEGGLPPRASTLPEIRIAEKEGLVKKLEDVVGLIGTAGKRYTEDFVSPVQARQTDALSYRQSAQNAALNVEDTKTELARKQLDALLTQNQTLESLSTAIANGQRDLANALRGIRMTAP